MPVDVLLVAGGRYIRIARPRVVPFGSRLQLDAPADSILIGELCKHILVGKSFGRVGVVIDDSSRQSSMRHETVSLPFHRLMVAGLPVHVQLSPPRLNVAVVTVFMDGPVAVFQFESIDAVGPFTAPVCTDAEMGELPVVE